MIIKSTKKTIFNDYLKWIDPVLNLSENERTILAGYLLLLYSHKQRFNDLDTLNELLFSQSTADYLIQKHDLTQRKFDNIIERLLLKECLQKYKVKTEDTEKELLRINQYLTNFPKNSKFEINIKFSLN